MGIVRLSANLKPVGGMRIGNGNISDKRQLIAKRTILGTRCEFFSNGEHTCDRRLCDQEQHDSQLLKFAHASIIAGEPVGDKNRLWVDATKNPVEVWIYGSSAEVIRARAREADVSIVDMDPLQSIRILTYGVDE